MRWIVLLVLVGCSPHVVPGTIEVFFCSEMNCEDLLLSQLNASSDIQCAFYDLKLEKVREMLARKNADVVLHTEDRSGLMHHKFCVLDDEKVLTGSMNPTNNGAYKNDNNVVLISSRAFVDAYLREFAQLDGKKRSIGPVTDVLSGADVILLFCPQDPCEEVVLREINAAERTVFFMTFSFTSDPIGDALLDAHDRDVAVRGVFEKRQRSKYSEYEKLDLWGLNVTYDGNKATMHHKVFIIDNTTVITGSYNPTWSGANKNDENLLIIKSERIAREYLDEFDRVSQSAYN